MFDKINHTLSAAVADNGTFTVSYPTGRSAGSYVGGHAHKMFVNQSLYSAPGDFTLSFGASSITVTWKADTTLLAGVAVALQVDRLGEDSNQPGGVILPDSIKRADLHLIDLGSPAATDADGILNDASATDSAQSYDSGDFVATFTGTLDVPRNLTATGTAGSNHVITVTGTDVFGATLKESLTLNGTNVIAGKKAFKTLTGIAVAAGAAGDTFDLGWGDVLGLPAYLPHTSHIFGELVDGVNVVKPTKVYVQDHMLEAAVDAGTSLELFSPVAGNITRVSTVARGTITTGGAITVEVNTVAVDGLSVVVADGAAAGDYDTDTPTAGHATTAVAVGDRIEIIPAAGFNASADIFVIVEIEVASASGTAVAGVTSAATATTGDVRGTYDPADACDGAKAFNLLVTLPDPGNRGVAQYAG